MSGHPLEPSGAPFFTVIVPTYNRAEKLHRAVMSVLAQSFGDFELLIMDDGSRDNTEATIAAVNDNRVHYHWAPNSGGPATPRNRGITFARGQWLCFLDADDLWYPDKLQTICDSIAADPTVDVICHDEYQRNVQSNELTYLRFGPDSPKLYEEMLLNGNRLSCSATVVRRTAIEQSDIKFNQSAEYFAVEDYDFWLQLARQGYRFRFISIPLGEYFIDGDNISAEPVRNRNNLGVLLHDHVFLIQSFDANRDRLWHRVSLRLKIYDIKVMLVRQQYIKAAVEIFRTLLRNPFTCAAYGSALLARRIYQRDSIHS